MKNGNSLSITRLIAVPALITLAVTILRLVGELQHWPSLLFNSAAGGWGAIVGIPWLPIIFGPYFAIKLASAGEGPASAGKSIGFALLGGVAWFVFLFAAFRILPKHPWLSLPFFVLTLAAMFIPGIGWGSLGRTLIAYALTARIPVLIVMYLALSGNGGQGWGTHYDRVMAQLAHATVLRKWMIEALVPQATMWMGWTVCLGAIVGTIVSALAYRGKQTTEAAA